MSHRSDYGMQSIIIIYKCIYIHIFLCACKHILQVFSFNEILVPKPSMQLMITLHPAVSSDSYLTQWITRLSNMHKAANNLGLHQLHTNINLLLIITSSYHVPKYKWWVIDKIFINICNT